MRIRSDFGFARLVIAGLVAGGLASNSVLGPASAIAASEPEAIATSVAASASAASAVEAVYLGERYEIPAFDAAALLRPFEWAGDERVPIADVAFRSGMGLGANAKARRMRRDPLTDPAHRAVREYLAGSRAVVDSLRLRMRARAAALQVATDRGERARKGFLEAHRLDPVGLKISPECRLGMSTVWRPVRLDEGKTSRWIGSMMYVRRSGPRGDVDVSIAARMENDTLALSFCHENAHGMMHDLYGPAFPELEQVSRIGHKTGLVTDRGLAWVEGFAESFETLYGSANPIFEQGKADPEAYGLVPFELARQDPIRRDAYVWNGRLAEGTATLKTGLEMISTEGVVAAFCHDLLVSKAITDPFTKLCVVMAEKHPADVLEAAEGLIELYPKDARAVAGLFLDNTRCVTASAEAGRAYVDLVRARKAARANAAEEGGGDGMKTLVDPAVAEASRRYRALRDELVRVAAADPERLSENVGPDLWVRGRSRSGRPSAHRRCACAECSSGSRDRSGQTTGAVARGANARGAEFRINLNLVRAATLQKLGWSRAEAERLVTERAGSGYFDTESASEVLRRILGDARFRSFSTWFSIETDEPDPSDDTPALDPAGLDPAGLDPGLGDT